MALKRTKGKSREDLAEMVESFYKDSTTDMFIALNRKMSSIAKVVSATRVSGELNDETKDNIRFIIDIAKESAKIAHGMALLKDGADKDAIEKEFSFENMMDAD